MTHSEKLLVQEVGDETVIFDQERNRAHRLNRTAALVWQHCGEKTVAEIAALLHSELGLPADEDVVWLALDRLEKAHLLPERAPRPEATAGVTRRQVVRKLALAGGLTLLLPVVQSIVAPTPAMAASFGCTKNGQFPTVTKPCCSGMPVNPTGRCRS